VVENLIGDPAFPYPFGHACKHSFGLEEINRYCIRWSGIVDGSGINGEKKFDARHLQWQIQRSKAEDQSPDKKGPLVSKSRFAGVWRSGYAKKLAEVQLRAGVASAFGGTSFLLPFSSRRAGFRSGYGKVWL
jgi:hypothetical protein